jgi:hypothetical protein
VSEATDKNNGKPVGLKLTWPSRDSKLKPPEYEAGVLSAAPRRSATGVEAAHTCDQFLYKSKQIIRC